MVNFLLKKRKRFLSELRVRAQLDYNEAIIPQGGAKRISVKLEKHGLMRIKDESDEFERVHIGGSEDFANRLYLDCRSVFARVNEPRREPIFWLTDLSHEEDREFVKSAPKMIMNGLNWGTEDLMYLPYDYPMDKEVSANQKAALCGEIDGIKLFAVECRLMGQIACVFYNEKTQQLSYYILNYTKYMPNVISVEREKERYLLVYADDRAASDNYMLQYRDANGDKIYKKTYVGMIAR